MSLSPCRPATANQTGDSVALPGMLSEQFKKMLQVSDGRDQPLLGQDRKISFNAQWRKLQAGSNLAKRGADKIGCERKSVPEKVVWVLHLDQCVVMFPDILEMYSRSSLTPFGRKLSSVGSTFSMRAILNCRKSLRRQHQASSPMPVSALHHWQFLLTQ